MPDLTREEVERRLEETAYDLGHPESWADMHMDACQCSRCGRWLQIVRPGKWQCECDGEPDEKYGEREALQAAQSLYAKLDELAIERDDWRDAAKVNRDEARKLRAERDQLAAEGRVLREALELAEIAVAYADCDTWATGSAWPTCDCDKCVATRAVDQALNSSPLIAAEVVRVKRLEAVAEAAEEYRSSQRVLMLNEIKADEPKYERQRKAKTELDAALAAWREGEGTGDA